MIVVTIWKPGSALERCSVCGLQRQYHDRASEPHDLVPETLADFDPGDLSPEQLVIAQSCAGSENVHVQRIGRQAECGIAEADRYLADPDWSTDGLGQEVRS